jgi:hypothetical protein
MDNKDGNIYIEAMSTNGAEKVGAESNYFKCQRKIVSDSIYYFR